MSSDFAIRVERLSKCYLIYDKPQDRLKQYLLPRLRRMAGLAPGRHYREFWALKDISLNVPRGETVGIIGRNGSGKSTLLQMICGTLTPTSGAVQTEGRVAALLELGSGFNPEFSGRENIYMNGTILGMSESEIDAKFDQIVAFADIGEHLEQPTKTYSSGMAVRLAFAVQALCDPDILVVDEALAVGDARFQAKCFERLKQLKEQGTSILLVTHSSEQIVTHCSQAILIENGQVHAAGSPRDVVNIYHDLLFGQAPVTGSQASSSTVSTFTSEGDINVNLMHDVFGTHPGYNPHEYRWGDGQATILDYFLHDGSQPYPQRIESGSRINLQVAIRFNSSVQRPILGITIKNREGVTIAGSNSEMQGIATGTTWGRASCVHLVSVQLVCQLAAGDYFFSIGVASRNGDIVVPHDRRYDAIHFEVPTDPTFFGIANLGIELAIHDAST